MKRKSILFVHPFLPYPLVSGGHQALFNGIIAVKDDYDVTLAFEGIDNTQMHDDINAFIKLAPNVELRPLLHAIPNEDDLSMGERIYSRIRKVYRFLVEIIKRVLRIPKPVPAPDDISDWWVSTITPSSKEWFEHIYNVSRERHYDLIQIEMPWLVKDVLVMPAGVRVLYVHHEIGFVRRCQELKSVCESPYYMVRKMFADYNEIYQLNRYDGIVTLSEVDKDKLIGAGITVPVYPSFSVVGVSKVPLKTDGTCRKLVFLGAGSHAPNEIGVLWFLENCWSKLLEESAEYTLHIVGKWQKETMAEITLKYQNVCFSGYVDDLSDVLAGSIMIVPITIGSGIRMKILEAARYGIPFVSTTIGAEGLGFSHEENCFITDDPDEFAADILKLNDSNLRNKFVSSAYNIVTNNYSMKALRESRLMIYESVLK